jgi:transcriptional regulator with XRE-family HTH domain
MPRFDGLTDAAVLRELGRRLETHRLARNLTQVELSELAGVGRSTVQNIESGGGVQTLSLVKILRALELLGEVDAAIPETIVLPVSALDRARPERRRARHGRPASDSDDAPEEPWTWGDEP